MQLAIHGLFELLTTPHAALGKLPAAAADLTAEKTLAAAAHQDDADVGSISVRINDVAHGSRWSLPQAH